MQLRNYVIACKKVDWKFRCSQHWDALSETARVDVRYCDKCRKKVYLARTAAELNELARQGACIAWPGDPDCQGGLLESMVIGEVDRGSLFPVKDIE